MMSGMFDPAAQGSKRSSRFAARALVSTATAIAFVGIAGVPAFAAPGDISTDTTVVNVGVSGSIVLAGLTSSFALNGVAGATVAGEAAVTMNVTTTNLTGYNVTVQSQSPTLDPLTAGNTDTIPIGAVGVREHVVGDAGTATGFSALSDTAPVTVHTQAGRSAALGDTITNDFSVLIPFVADDVYSATLDYVATAL